MMVKSSDALSTAQNFVHIVSFFFVASPVKALSWWVSVFPESSVKPSILLGEATDQFEGRVVSTCLIVGALPEKTISTILEDQGFNHHKRKMVLKSWSGYFSDRPLMTFEEYRIFSEQVPDWSDLGTHLSLVLPSLNHSIVDKILDSPDQLKKFYDTILFAGEAWVSSQKG